MLWARPAHSTKLFRSTYTPSVLVYTENLRNTTDTINFKRVTITSKPQQMDRKPSFGCVLTVATDRTEPGSHAARIAAITSAAHALLNRPNSGDDPHL
jgi:hypothetical protein